MESEQYRTNTDLVVEQQKLIRSGLKDLKLQQIVFNNKKK